MSENHTLSSRAQALYEALFKRSSSTPDRDYEAICRAWVKYSAADTVWLWLAHEEDEGRTWHLVAHAKQEGLEVEDPHPICYPAYKNPSVVEYSAVKKKAVFVEEIEVWSEPIDSVTYKVQNRAGLEAMGCKSFITIPLIGIIDPEESNPDFTDDGTQDTVVGAICLHYRRSLKATFGPETKDEFMVECGTEMATEPVPAPRATLQWMGRFTAIALDHSKDALQSRTLRRLNALAGRHLVASSRTPETARRAYLKELMQLIQTEFQIEGISLFYRKSSHRDRVSLLYTTGVSTRDNPGVRLEENKWPSLTYELHGESRTSTCFRTGKIMPLNEGVPEDTPRPESYEIRAGGNPKESKNWQDPALLMPIPLPSSEEVSQDAAHALGVLRFAYHRWTRFGTQHRAFDPVEIQTLTFVAEQIGPVLETMARNVEVDKAIADLRHELRNSTKMINQLVEQMTQGMGKPSSGDKREVEAFNLWDLKFSALLVRAQVQRLYRDETESKKLDIESTQLYGKIIARLCEVCGRYAQKEKKMEVKLDHQGFAQWPALHIDRWYVEQALLNVLLNAVKYGDEGTDIRVWQREVWQREGSNGYYLCVSNAGIGIVEEDKERIFESSYRSDTAKETAMGAGLGLSIARIIMRRHGGDVLVTALHKPTTFALFFPAALRFSAPQP